MKVFISHKKEDDLHARFVANRLRVYGHSYYLDVIDDSLGKNGDDLADHIREKMTGCDSLIAVVSAATISSWWVPWEIGLATEKDYPLSTYLTDHSHPPEYLRKWPVLRSGQDLDQFASRIKTFEQLVNTRAMHKSLGAARRETAREFHNELKRAIGQSI